MTEQDPDPKGRSAPRRILMDIRPLKESPAYRRLWAGQSLSAVGSQMTVFAVSLQVYTITHSSAAVGAVGLMLAVPAIAFSLLGGTFGDATDRRKLVLYTSICLAGVSTLFAVQAFADLHQVWLLYCLVVVQSLLGSVNTPARRTFMPRLLPPEQIPAGAALSLITVHVSSTAGPALAGVVAGTWGLKACYLIDALSFAAALYGVARLPAMPPTAPGTRPGLQAVREALHFIRTNQIISGAFLADLSATVLGTPTALFPAINTEHFGGTAQTLGLLTAAPAIGGLMGAALSGPVRQVSHHGRAMLIACAIWGAAIAAFGGARNLWLALPLLVLAGAVDAVNVMLRTSMVQVTTPDTFRGRVSAAEYLVGVGGPQLGNFRAGTVGSLTSPTIGAVSGGCATVVAAATIGVGLRSFAHYQAHRGANTTTAELEKSA